MISDDQILRLRRFTGLDWQRPVASGFATESTRVVAVDVFDGAIFVFFGSCHREVWMLFSADPTTPYRFAWRGTVEPDRHQTWVSSSNSRGVDDDAWLDDVAMAVKEKVETHEKGPLHEVHFRGARASIVHPRPPEAQRQLDVDALTAILEHHGVPRSTLERCPVCDAYKVRTDDCTVCKKQTALGLP